MAALYREFMKLPKGQGKMAVSPGEVQPHCTFRAMVGTQYPSLASLAEDSSSSSTTTSTGFCKELDSAKITKKEKG